MPAYKIVGLTPINPVQSINGVSPDSSGNVTIKVDVTGTVFGTGGNGGGGNSYLFKEDIFEFDTNSITLTQSPVPGVPVTVTINGLTHSHSDYSVAGKLITLNNDLAVEGDIIRVFYAYYYGG